MWIILLASGQLAKSLKGIRSCSGETIITPTLDLDADSESDSYDSSEGFIRKSSELPRLDFKDATVLERYEEFVRTSEYGNLMQSLNWGKVKNNWHQDAVYLEQEGQIVAALTILTIETNGSAFSYAPRGPVCDLKDIDKMRELIQMGSEIARERGSFALRIDPEVPYDPKLVEAIRSLNVPNLNLRDLGSIKNTHRFSNPARNIVLDLKDKDYETFFNELASKRRTQIRKTYKVGVETRILKKDHPDFDQALNTFYEITKVMSERHGILYRPLDYFYRLFDAFEDVTLYESYFEDQVLASSIVISYNRKAFYIYGASSNELRSYDAPTQMQSVAIEDATKKPNITEYDFGGVFNIDPNDGLYSFKTKFTGPEGLRELIGELDFVFDEEAYQNFIR